MKNNYHLNDLRRGNEKHVNEGLEKHSIFFYAFSSSNQFTFSFHGDLLFGFFPLAPFAIFPSAHLLPICKFTSSEASEPRSGWWWRKQWRTICQEKIRHAPKHHPSKFTSRRIMSVAGGARSFPRLSARRVTNDSQIGQTNHRRIMTKWFPWELICIRLPADCQGSAQKLFAPIKKLSMTQWNDASNCSSKV